MLRRKTRRSNKSCTSALSTLVNTLEPRVLLTSLLDPNTGILAIAGTNRADDINVYRGNTGSENVIVVMTGNTPQTFPADGVTQLTFQGYAGADFFQNHTDIPLFAAGGFGDDTLIGGTGSDTLNGQAGSDYLEGNAGDDFLIGGAGYDTLMGGVGSDTLNGQGGHDLLAGDADNDYLYGGSGNDTLEGGAGNDVVKGQSGVDLVVATGDVDFLLTDLLLTGLGTDRLDDVEQAELSGGDGDNVIDASGFSGSVTLMGGAGNDELTGGLSADSIDAGAGDDTLHAGIGGDRLEGGAGVDLIVAAGDFDFTLSNSTLTGLDTSHILNIELAQLTGGTGNNVLDASTFSGNVTLYGGTGDDSLSGGAGNDLLVGDDGADVIDGGKGDDRLLGDGGNDTLIGGGGQDQLSGGDGDDLLQSAAELEMQVVHVTTLSPDGPGSLTDALTQGNRTIVFDVSGVIDLRSVSAARPDYVIAITNSNIVIDGESAPVGGITIVGAGIQINNAENVTLRHLRIRVGDDPVGPELSNRDALSILGSENVLIQNVSLSWSLDELAEVWGGSRNVIFDQVLFGEPLDAGGHGHGLLIGDGSTEVVVSNSVFAHLRKRAPKFGFGTDEMGFSSGLLVNNIIYNPRGRAIIVGDGASVAAIGNLVIPGLDTREYISLLEVQPDAGHGTEVFLQDNFFARADVVMEPDPNRIDPLFTSPATYGNPEAYDWNVSYRNGYPGIRGAVTEGLWNAEVTAVPDAWMADRLAEMNVRSVTTVLDNTLATAGAFFWDRDATDQRVIADVQNGSGHVINSQSEVEGLPEYTAVAVSQGTSQFSIVQEDDQLDGGAGNDTVIGGQGNDWITGGDGDDLLIGGSRNDTLLGEAGDDELRGGVGDDLLQGAAGVDQVFGNRGNDTVTWTGGDDADVFNGGQGSDSLQVTGTALADIIQLSGENSSLLVSVNSVTLVADAFESTAVDGAAGNDEVTTDDLQGITTTSFANNFAGVPVEYHLRIEGGSGDDILNAALQTNPFVFLTLDGGEENDTITLPDRLDLTPVGSPTSGNQAFGGDGDDTIVGGNAAELILGGNGNDQISGAGGNDTISGGAGLDWIHGGSGSDYIDGGDDADTLLGGTGDDLMHGGSGDDRLDGQVGVDSLAGGSGDNTLTTVLDEDFVDEAFADWFTLNAQLLSTGT